MSRMGNILDRDLSQIEFYRRVLDEARDETNPLLERVKFLSILGTIVDEFAAAHHADLLRKKGTGAFSELTGLLDEAKSYLRDALAPALSEHGIHLIK